MLNIDSLEKGVVIDHIESGKSMEIYRVLELDKLDCSVAIIKNARSKKSGRKDIIKIEEPHHREKAPAAARAHRERCQVQEPPLHHQRGAGAGPCVRAHRPREGRLPLHVLRAGV